MLLRNWGRSKSSYNLTGNPGSGSAIAGANNLVPFALSVETDGIGVFVKMRYPLSLLFIG